MELTRFLPSKQLLSHLQGSVGYLSALQQIVMGVADSVAEIDVEECILCSVYYADEYIFSTAHAQLR